MMTLSNEHSFDGGGFVVTQFTAPCTRGGCTNAVWHSIASHGGDMEDVESPIAGWCKACRDEAEAAWRMLQTPGLDHEAALTDPDDLPFD